MDRLPDSNQTIAVRTDFSDDKVWQEVRDSLVQEVDGFRAYLDFVDDPQYESLGVDSLPEILPLRTHVTFIVLVDAEAISSPEHHVLVVDLTAGPRSFRVIPSQLWGVENNLSTANMDWEEFAEHADLDGVFRGFPTF